MFYIREPPELNSITLGDDFCVRGVMSGPDAVEHPKMQARMLRTVAKQLSEMPRKVWM